MNAAKRKQKSSSGSGLVLGFIPVPTAPWRGALAGLLVVAGALGGAYYGWHRWGQQVVQSPDYQLLPENINITPSPPWIRSDVKAEAVRDGNLNDLSILDRQLTVTVARAFSMHTWVEEVTRVSKRHPAQVSVDLIYRQPVAMVEVMMNDRPGLLPVDVNGILLPPGDFSAEQARDYLRIAVGDTTPSGPLGTPWGDSDVHGGARVSAVLLRHWKQLGLYRIEVGDDQSSVGTVDDVNFLLATRQGARVVWGTAPRVDDPADMRAAQAKLTHLLDYVAVHGPLDAQSDAPRIDLTQIGILDPHTADIRSPRQPASR